ncbi:hypothetical protein ElyMa_003968700 [Elysia marginata]|uniref:VWFD domain-containing protein n=1 Tax=Elysia marginata TaxID=1093978 RepID=A0AAV4FVR6_9GAST|nr:hypothetical protein ElyMa_003968700 [Elysia marginata]
MKVIILFLALFAVSFAQNNVCDSRGRSCIVGKAECIGGKCVCQAPNTWGDGAFNCYKPNEVAAQVLNDPVLTNFNNESLEFPFPCRYLTTHFINDMMVGGNKIGTCEFMIYSFNAKKRGKFFLHGYDVATALRYDSGEVVKMSSRHYGVAKYGVYHFKNRAILGEFNQDGPWRDDRIRYADEANKVYVFGGRDVPNNQHIYSAEQCGLRVTFVPYDIKDRRAQPSMPGISISVNTNYNTRWLSRDEVVALPPGVSFADKQINQLSIEQSMFVRAFKTPFVQNQPMKDKGKCDATKKAFHKCTRPEVRKAMTNCYWILNQPRFMYCFDKSRSARNILRLFSTCIKVFCGSAKCSKVQDMIIKSGCDSVRDIPELPGFMNGDFCPK